jgi:hypothetical protein
VFPDKIECCTSVATSPLSAKCA